ncbi:MAG: NADPH:quinone oxidoreductase family protein [Thiotrichales bacterium]|nr:NADPH:quinone oxidoreductase family protein [Thiotrichales bacterium]MCY4350594.1 NADPH:quinone oxidoreductase family protein [Thiotrichales bacterium]
MRAVVCRAWGPPESLMVEEVPEPRPGPDDVLIQVRACGVNFADALIVQGTYQEKPLLPFTPGLEVAGEIVAMGRNVAGFATGQRVAALCATGGYAETVTAPAAVTVQIPDSMPYETAAGFLVAYGTAHVGLDYRARLGAGETLLVHGAAGGVGLAAVEVGKAMGATVIATAGSQDKRALASSRGADHVIDYRAGEFKDLVKMLTDDRGTDVVFDPVGGSVLAQSMRCIAWGGRLLVIGFAAGDIPQVPAGLVLVKNISLIGVYWGAYRMHDPAVITRSLHRLFKWFERGALRPMVSETLPLERAAQAMRRLLDREARGKIVLTTAG